MSRQLSYADAAKILGGGQNKIFSALDKIVGGLLLGGSVMGMPDILGWFDAKGEFVRLTREAVASLAGWRVGATRHDRSDQLRAAHAALALAAFIEEVARLRLPFDVSKLKLDKRDAINFGGGRASFVKINQAFVEDLLKTAVPMPNPIDTRGTFLRAMTAFYDGTTKRFVDLIKGLEIWDRLDEVARESVESKSGDLSRRSIIRYEEFFISLAGEFPEVACWANFASHSATQHEISAVRISLRRIEKFLQSHAANVPQGVWDGIARSNRAALAPSILDAANVPHGLIFPDLSSLYIGPSYRVARCSPNVTISREDS
jgi:NACHT N-terminal Helical domain 7